MTPEGTPANTLAAMASTAEQYLRAQSWCGQVYSVTPVFAVDGVLGVFRCTLLPSQPDADMMVWVVVGDLPSAYLVHEPGDTWRDALFAYVTEMGRWVAAVRDGQSPGADIIPVEAPPTREHAEMLASRLEFIRAHLVDVDKDSVESDV